MAGINKYSIDRKERILPTYKVTGGYLVSIYTDRAGWIILQNEFFYKYGEEEKLLKWWAGYQAVGFDLVGHRTKRDEYLGINPKGTYETLEAIDIVEHCENGDKYEIKIKREGWK